MRSGENRHIELRAPMMADADALCAAINDWDIVQWLSSVPWPYGRADMDLFLATKIADNSDLFRIICVDDVPAGVVAIEPRGHGPNLGYWLRKRDWGRGVMSYAADQVTQTHFARTSETLKSGARDGNVASLRIQAKLGFEVCEQRQQFFRPHGMMLPMIITQLSATRFAGRPERP